MKEQKLLNIIKEIKDHENFMKSLKQNNIEDKCYLIDDELMKELKNKIHYEELKNHFKDESYISKILKSEKIIDIKNINFINQSKFKNNQELEKALNANKKYWVINFSLWKLICIKEKENDKGIDYFFEDNQIILKLNENEKISFRKNNCIIDKYSLNSYIVSNRQNDLTKSKKIQMKNKGVTSRNYKLNNINKIGCSYSLKDMCDNDLDLSNLDSFCCIKCKSEIILESIDFNFEKRDNFIIFECNGNCGKIKISIKEYLQIFAKKSFLNKKSIISKYLTVNNNQENNSLIYSINFKNAVCSIYKRKNKKNCQYCNLKITKNKCLMHDNYFCCYCIDDKKQLCDECLIQDCHLKCNKVEMNKISTPIITDEEIELFKYIIETFKNKKNSYKNYYTNESDIEISYNKRKKDLLSQYQKKFAKEEEEENNQINRIKQNFEEKEIETNKNYFNELNNISNNIVKDITASFHILEAEEEKIKDKNTIKCIEEKYKLFDKFFNELENIKNRYKNELTKIRKNKR